LYCPGFTTGGAHDNSATSNFVCNSPDHPHGNCKNVSGHLRKYCGNNASDTTNFTDCSAPPAGAQAIISAAGLLRPVSTAEKK